MFSTRTITSNAQDNKNKTNRLTNNKNCPKTEPVLVGSKDHCNSATKAIRLLLAPDWEGHEGKLHDEGTQQKQEARNQK
jgi:hypothetical protein